MPDFTLWFIGHCEQEDIDVRVMVSIPELWQTCNSLNPKEKNQGRKPDNSDRLIIPVTDGELNTKQLPKKDKKFLRDFGIDPDNGHSDEGDPGDEH